MKQRRIAARTCSQRHRLGSNLPQATEYQCPSGCQFSHSQTRSTSAWSHPASTKSTKYKRSSERWRKRKPRSLYHQCLFMTRTKNRKLLLRERLHPSKSQPCCRYSPRSIRLRRCHHSETRLASSHHSSLTRTTSLRSRSAWVRTIKSGTSRFE